MYQRQLSLARQYRERTMEATSYGALGLANRLMKKFDKALGYHTQELTLRQEICDMLGNFTFSITKIDFMRQLNLCTWKGSSNYIFHFLGECRALSHLGAVHMALQNYTHAIKCYQEQLERAQDLQDSAIEAESFGNLGIAKLNR